jgi:hypothetical protein
MIDWQTHAVSPTPSPHWWKKSMGEACPHDREIFLVNGTFVRNNFDSDWVQGGHGYRYRFCSRREIWIDDSMPESELPYVLIHECSEIEWMRQGIDYDHAHDRAKRLENKFRRQDHPGEGRSR